MPRRYRGIEDDDYDWMPYVSVGERRRKAERAAAKVQDSAPVIIKGNRIAQTFWGKAWCENLEHYSDYANRLPRGRTYVRSGCVIDLKITRGVVNALVSGSRIYDVQVAVAPIPKQRWKAVCHDVAGQIGSLVSLVKGEFDKTVMERLCQQKTGLFPQPAEIKFNCNCPDSARMCKHISAVLYGIGARLDENPELLFVLRDVNQQDLIASAGQQMTKPKTARLLESGNLSEIFGIEIVERSRKRLKK
jgi:uncharacterized Zn finger protein